MTTAKARKVVLIPGDGIGKEVMAIGAELLETLREVRGISIETITLDVGADRFLRDGATFPAADQQMIRDTADAVLLGALGDPRVPDLGYARDILFGLRFGLDLFSNIRPITCLADRLLPLKDKRASDCDMVVFRENTEGVYVGVGGNFKKGTHDEIAINEDVNSRKGVERVIRAALAYARAHGRKRVTAIHKANIMKMSDGLFLNSVRDVARGYRAIAYDERIIDAVCMQLVLHPDKFDVLVLPNLYGDIVSDLCAGLVGGLGVVGAANLGADCAVFEAVHGSAPDIAGKGIANPTALLLSAVLMLRHIGENAAADRIVHALERVMADPASRTPDLGGRATTRQFADAVCKML